MKYRLVLIFAVISLIAGSCGPNKEYQAGLEKYEKAVLKMETNMKMLEQNPFDDNLKNSYNNATVEMESAAKEINSLAEKKVRVSDDQNNKAHELNNRVKSLNDKMQALNKKVADEEAAKAAKAALESIQMQNK